GSVLCADGDRKRWRRRLASVGPPPGEGRFDLKRKEAAPEMLGAEFRQLFGGNRRSCDGARHVKSCEAALPSGDQGKAVLPRGQGEGSRRFGKFDLDDLIWHGLAPPRHLAELQPVKPCELALAPQQDRRGATLYDTAAPQHDDLISIRDRR